MGFLSKIYWAMKDWIYRNFFPYSERTLILSDFEDSKIVKLILTSKLIRADGYYTTFIIPFRVMEKIYNYFSAPVVHENHSFYDIVSHLEENNNIDIFLSCIYLYFTEYYGIEYFEKNIKILDMIDFILKRNNKIDYFRLYAFDMLEDKRMKEAELNG